ncbi:MAG: hypothetical protein ACRBBN_12595 [Methyloligellaceae bacterium]
MQRACRATLIALLCILTSLVSKQNAHAHGSGSGCYPKILTFTVDNANYDPQAPGDTKPNIYYTIRNKGTGYCNNLKVYFCTDKNYQINGSEKLQYSVRNSGGANVLNTGLAAGCPYYSHTLGVKAIQELDLPPGGSSSSMSNFELVIPGMQFLTAGDYNGTTLQMAVYNKYGKKKDSSSETPSTNIKPSCFLPSLPTPGFSTNAVYSPTGGLNGGAVSFNQAIDKNTARLKQSTIHLLFPGARCNYRAYLSIKSVRGGMVNSENLQQVSSFLNKIDYTASATFCGISTQFNTVGTGLSGSSKQCSITNAAQSDLNLTIQTIPGNTPLLAGTYNDTLVIKIGSPL